MLSELAVVLTARILGRDLCHGVGSDPEEQAVWKRRLQLAGTVDNCLDVATTVVAMRWTAELAWQTGLWVLAWLVAAHLLQTVMGTFSALRAADFQRTSPSSFLNAMLVMRLSEYLAGIEHTKHMYFGLYFLPVVIVVVLAFCLFSAFVWYTGMVIVDGAMVYAAVRGGQGQSHLYVLAGSALVTALLR
jgi:hypothetical protein